MEEPRVLQSIESQRIAHNFATEQQRRAYEARGEGRREADPRGGEEGLGPRLGFV